MKKLSFINNKSQPKRLLWRSFFIFSIALITLTSCKKLLPTNIYPYNMVAYQNGKFVDKSEVTIEQYAEFIYDGNEAHKPTEKFSNQFAYHQVFYPAKPADSLYNALGKIGYYNLPVPTEYFDTLNYKELRNILDFPITGITHADAEAYCLWRTKKYNNNNTKHTKKSITFVLPDAVVFLPENPKNLKKYTPSDIARVYSKKHAKLNEKGVFGLNSNVAEMTSSSSLVYGVDSLLQFSPENLQAPHQLVGFRCVGLVKD